MSDKASPGRWGGFAVLGALLIIAVVFAVLMSAKAQYYMSTLTLFRATAVATGNIGDASVKIATADMTRAKGISKLNQERGRLTKIRRELRKQQPPFGSQPFHNHFLKALSIYIRASDTLAAGYKEDDKIKINSAIKLWADGKDEFDRTFSELDSELD